MTRDDVVMGMTDAALAAYRRRDLHSDEAKMLTAIREALAYLDDHADLSVMKRYVEGEWSRQELSAMRYDLALAEDETDAEKLKRLKSVMYDAAHLAATLGSGSDGCLRGRFMSISNALNAALGRSQSSHGDQYDSAGNITKDDPLED